MKILRIPPYLLLFPLFVFSCTTKQAPTDVLVATAKVPADAPIQKEELPLKDATNVIKELGVRYGAARQIFTINNLKDTLITGSKGTRIFLPKNCFVPSRESMKVIVKEVYNLNDFVYNNLTTATTDGKLLSSNGMIFMDVEGDDKVTINKNKPVKLKFPSADTKPSDLFLAVKDGQGQLKWSATNTTTGPTDAPLISINKKVKAKVREEEVATDSSYNYFEGIELIDLGTASCYKGYDTISKGMEYPYAQRRKNITGLVYLDLTVNDLGQLQTVALVQGVNKEIDEVIINAVKRKKEWVPAFVNRRPETSVIRYKFVVNGSDKNYKIDLPKPLCYMNERDMARYKYWQSLRKSYTKERLKELEDKKAFDDNLSSGSAEAVSIARERDVKGYIYPLLSLGRWINCDRIIYSTRNAQAQVIIKSTVYSAVSIMAILLDQNRSAIYCSSTGNGLFKSPVLDKTATVALVGMANASDNSPMFFIKRLNGIGKDTLDVEFKKTTYKELKEAIDNIASPKKNKSRV